MSKTYDLSDGARLICDRLEAAGQRFWMDRASEMFRSLVYSNHTPVQVRDIRVSKDWPLSGSITFTRVNDGAKCRLWLKKSKKTANGFGNFVAKAFK